MCLIALISGKMKPQVGSFSGHLLQLPHGELIYEFKNRLNAHRIGKPLTDSKVLLQNQHSKSLVLK